MPCEKTSVIEVSEASVILLKNGQEGATQEKKTFEYKENDCNLYKTCSDKVDKKKRKKSRKAKKVPKE